MAEVCSNPSCSEPGTLKCSRCKTARYCGQGCQRSQWTAHKAACKAASEANIPKSNCYILRAAPQLTTADNAPPVIDNIAAQIAPFHLLDLGNELKEKRQLEKHLRWKSSIEVGKFYDHTGEDGWYYYVYGDERAFDNKKSSSGLPLNEAAGLVCHKRPVYGDVAIVRSGPVGSEYAEEFTRTELATALEFYKTNERDQVFMLRERSRMARVTGWPGAGEAVPVRLEDLLPESVYSKYV